MRLLVVGVVGVLSSLGALGCSDQKNDDAGSAAKPAAAGVGASDSAAASAAGGTRGGAAGSGSVSVSSGGAEAGGASARATGGLSSSMGAHDGAGGDGATRAGGASFGGAATSSGGAVGQRASGGSLSGSGASGGASSDAAGRAGEAGTIASSVGGTNAGGAQGTSGAATGPAGAGGTSGDAGPYRDLAFAGLVSAVELAPVRWAANGIYPAKVSISSGGVDNLFDANAPLVATNAETQALRASVQHGNLRIIFTVCEGLYRIVAKKSSGINALADLRGKRIAAPSGTSSHYYLSRMLGSAGLTEQDVTLVNESPGMGTLNADAATIWEPGIQYVEDALGNDAVEFQNAADGNPVYRELFNLHATAESLADPVKRRTIVQFVRSLITASAQIREDPSVVFPLMLSPTGESQADLEKSWNYERFPGTLVSDILDVLEEEEPWRANLDHRSARTRDELAMLVDDSVVKEAMAQ